MHNVMHKFQISISFETSSFFANILSSMGSHVFRPGVPVSLVASCGTSFLSQAQYQPNLLLCIGLSDVINLHRCFWYCAYTPWEFPIVCSDQIGKCLRNIHENRHLLSPNLFHSVFLVLEEARFDSSAVKKLTSLRWVNSEQSEVSHSKTSPLLIFSRHFVRCSSLLVWGCLEGHEELSKWWLNLTKWLPPLTSDIMFSPASLFSLGLSLIASSFLFVVLFHRFPFSLSALSWVWFLFLTHPPNYFLPLLPIRCV